MNTKKKINKNKINVQKVLEYSRTLQTLILFREVMLLSLETRRQTENKLSLPIVLPVHHG